jgi:multiple sugar transport system permease protein
MTTESTLEPPRVVRPMRQGNRAKRRPMGAPPVWRSVLKHAVLIIVAVLMLYPLLWLLSSSFKPNDVIFRQIGLFPTQATVDNYVDGWTALGQPFSVFLLNSLVICIGAIIGNLFSCSLAAYAFARMRFKGRTLFFTIMLLTLMLPFQVTLVPQYILFSQLHWLNTILPLVVPKFLATDAFFVFLMVQFIRGIPRELDEAARVDGAGHIRIFFQLMLPLMVPALATTAIFTFIWTWNDFFSQLLYLTAPQNYTSAVALNQFLDQQGSSDYGGMFAMSVLCLAPLFFVFIFGQRYLLAGIATTGNK